MVTFKYFFSNSFFIFAGLSPSVCSGVVAKVVKAKAPPYYQSIQGGDTHIAAMLETTAAVHPGGSGGAVVNSEGHMIGLVTRYIGFFFVAVWYNITGIGLWIWCLSGDRSHHLI